MKKKNYFLLLVMATIYQFTASAQTIRLNLIESIELASDSSLQAFSSRNLYQARYWEYRSYRAARLPSLTLSTTPIRYNRDFVSRYDSENNIDVYRKQQSLYSYGNLSIRQNLDFTGGTFYIDSELGYLRNFGDNNISQFTTVPIRVGYSQALFGFNSFKWERKLEPLKFEKAKRQYLYSREEISEITISYFFNLAMAQVEYRLAKENVSSTDTLYNMGNERYKIASISQADLLTLKLDAVNAKNTLRNTEISLTRAMSGFLSYLNIQKDMNVELELPERTHQIVVSIEKALELAKENNPDYLVYQQELLEAEREVDRTKKSSTFDASISASIGFNQVAGSLSDAYRKPLQQDVAAIHLTIPLIDWGVRKGRANMAKNNLNVTRISIRQKETTLEEDIIMTVSDFNSQQDLIASAEEAMNLATLAYNSTKQRFMIGKADINSLTLSLGRLNTAQRNYITSLQNYWQSYYKLRKLTLYDFEKNKSLSYAFDELMNLR